MSAVQQSAVLRRVPFFIWMRCIFSAVGARVFLFVITFGMWVLFLPVWQGMPEDGSAVFIILPGLAIITVGIGFLLSEINKTRDRLKLLESALYTKGQLERYRCTTVPSADGGRPAKCEYTFLFDAQDGRRYVVNREADSALAKDEWGSRWNAKPIKASAWVWQPELEVDVYYDPQQPRSVVIPDLECRGIYKDERGNLRSHGVYPVIVTIVMPALFMVFNIGLLAVIVAVECFGWRLPV